MDVWDALHSNRPYRPAWSVGRVCDHIAGLAGTHFDPALIPLFLKTLDCPETVLPPQAHDTRCRAA